MKPEVGQFYKLDDLYFRVDEFVIFDYKHAYAIKTKAVFGEVKEKKNPFDYVLEIAIPYFHDNAAVISSQDFIARGLTLADKVIPQLYTTAVKRDDAFELTQEEVIVRNFLVNLLMTTNINTHSIKL